MWGWERSSAERALEYLTVRHGTKGTPTAGNWGCFNERVLPYGPPSEACAVLRGCPAEDALGLLWGLLRRNGFSR